MSLTNRIYAKLDNYLLKVCRKVSPEIYLDLKYKKVDVLTGGMGHVAMIGISKEGKRIISEIDGVSDVERKAELFDKLEKIVNKEVRSILYHVGYGGIAFINRNPGREEEEGQPELLFLKT